MTDAVHTYMSARVLSDSWDEAAAGQRFLSRPLLQLLEETNPCGQQYHVAGDSLAVTYFLRLNMFTYGRGSWHIPVTVVGVPCSVAVPGCHFGATGREALVAHLRALPGCKLVLNMHEPVELPGFIAGTTLPSCLLDVRWSSFEEYIGSLRSHYRRRVRQALAKGAGLQIRTLVDNTQFDPELYELYRAVYRRSAHKLECLSIDFFHRWPAQIIRFDLDGRAVGFVQVDRQQDRLVFMFGGLDYARLETCDTYLFMLLHLVRMAIEERCVVLDLGQTAEQTKLSLGCRLVPRYMYGAHANRLIHAVLQRLAGVLSYRVSGPQHHVFHA